MTYQLSVQYDPTPADLAAIAAEREAVCQRIKALPVHSHRRIGLQQRARQLTQQMMQMESLFRSEEL